MKCPYCDKDMERGIIQDAHGIYWLKKRRILNGYDSDAGEICLSPMKFSKVAIVTAWLCRDCQKVIINYPEEES